MKEKNSLSQTADSMQPLANNASFQPGTYTFLTGEAVPEVKPDSYSFSGNINAPYDYFKSKDSLLKFDNFALSKMVVEVSNGERPSIVFKQNTQEADNAFDKHTITGTVVLNELVGKLGLLSGKEWRPFDLYKELRKYPYIFVSGEKFMAFTKVLTNMKAKTEVQTEDSNDNRANVIKSNARKTETDLPEEVDLIIDLFPGTGIEPKRFTVLVENGVTDAGNITVSFFSPDLIQIIEKETNALLKKYIDLFKLANVPVIEK